MVIIKFSYRQQFLAKNFQVKAVQDVKSDVGASWQVLQLYRVRVEASEKSGIVSLAHVSFVWRKGIADMQTFSAYVLTR